MIYVQNFFADFNAVKTPCDIDESFLSGVIHSAEAVTRSSGDGMYIIDYTQKKVVYLSSNIASWCNMPPPNNSVGFDWCLKYICEEDLQMLVEINQSAFGFWKDMSDEECMHCVLSYDFRFCKSMVNQRYTPIAVKDGSVLIAMCMVSPSQSKKSGNIIMRSSDREYDYVYSREEKKWKKEFKLHLTSREKEIIRYTISGMSSVEIAEINDTSENTVKTQKWNLCHKLGVKTMTEAIRFAMINGLL